MTNKKIIRFSTTVHLKFAVGLIGLLFSGMGIVAQSNISLKIHTIGKRFGDFEYIDLSENNLGQNSSWLIQPGLILNYETFVLEMDHSVKLMQGFFLDPAAHLAGFTHIGYRNRLWKKWRNTLVIDIGPSLSYRKTWATFEKYKDHGDYDIYKDWEYRIMPICGELEYNFYLSNRSDICIAIQYAQPKIVSFSIGYKYWISTKIKHLKKCHTCLH